MPATAGRVRMPANNRVHSSAALQTHGIWQSAIGYDPYAPTKQEPDKSAAQSSAPAGGDDRADDTNAYASFQGLLALAKITGSATDETRGACKKCGRVGHLTFQCRNFLSVKDQKEGNELDESIRAANEVIGKLKKLKGKTDLLSSDEDEEESESSDSDVDPEIERILAERSGKNSKSNSKSKKESGKRGRSRHRKSSKRHSKSKNEEETPTETSTESEEEERRERKRKHRESRREKKRRRSRHRRKDESDSEREKRRKHKKKREEASESGAESSEEERKREKRRHRKPRGGSRCGSESEKERKRGYEMVI